MAIKINSKLPTIGILIFDGFLSNEVVAPMDVFTKKDSIGKTLFNVVLIAKEDKTYTSEEGLRVLSDYTIANSPELTVLIVPSFNSPDKQTYDPILINFIKKQNETVDYIVSHCAGAFMLAESGVANGKEIVTYPSGGRKLQEDYPELSVMDGRKISVVMDGKIISSNGNLVSYLASLGLLEQMTSKTHRKTVENELLIHKLN